MSIAALIVAAGRGMRAGGGNTPKQYQLIGGVPVLSHTVRVFAEQAEISVIALVIHADYETRVSELMQEFSASRIVLVHGGETRQQSVCAGLEALAAVSPEYVLIHDGARPFVNDALCRRVIAALETYQGAVPALAVADTLKRAEMVQDGAPIGTIETVERRGLYGAQTPQGFRYKDIMEAHRAAAETGRDDFTDDASIAEWRGLSLALVEGHAENQKITTADDLEAADLKLKCEDALSNKTTNQLEYRTGSGFDVHRFGDGDAVMLMGVTVPHTHGLTGHSDADVGLHALTDAILGAIGDGDIGTHFPPSDPRWKAASSDQFLIDAKQRVIERGGTIVHVDVTLICEAPKIAPHRARMTQRLSEILEISTDRISIKATTTEGLGFTGRQEGIAAMASATVALPFT